MKAKVLIGIPSSDKWSSDFGMSILGMTIQLALEAGHSGVSFQVSKQEGSLLPKSREACALKALENDNTHLLFVDTDQTFPANTLSRLLAHKKDVVACNIATKSVPSAPTARRLSQDHPEGILVYSREDSPELQRVWRIGTGIMLISTDVFRRIPQPWFPVTWRKEEKAYQGEDWNFCETVNSWGYKIYVDHRLSREVSHVGKFRFDHKVIDMQLHVSQIQQEERDASRV